MFFLCQLTKSYKMAFSYNTVVPQENKLNKYNKLIRNYSTKVFF